jgi:uncharacterized protein YunC (DUF1805 family)
MMNVHPIKVGDAWCTAIDVQLPKTRLLAIRTERGYVMCGALDVNLLRTRLADREILAARAVGVRTIDDLLNGQVESCTQTAEKVGIHPGMPIREALALMVGHEPTPS